MVAEAMQESASNIARMETIDKHLVGDWKRALKKGRISASTAYELSKLDKTAQKKLKEALPDYASPTAKLIKTAGEIVQDYLFAPLVCQNCPIARAPDTKIVLPWLRRVLARAAAMRATTPRLPALCGVCKKQITDAQRQAELRETERKADEAYQHSAYRQAQLSILDWAKDPNLMRTTNCLQESIRPCAVCAVLPIRLAGRGCRRWMSCSRWRHAGHHGCRAAGGLPQSCRPVHPSGTKYPVDKPNDGETVLCRYGRNDKFRLLSYKDGAFGDMLGKEFVSLPFEVSYLDKSISGGVTMLNKVILMGRFARDPECKYIGDRKVANFTLAVDRGRKNANGEREADFIDCAAWGQLGRVRAEMVAKGMMAIVVGRIQTRHWEDRNGNKRVSVGVQVDEITFARPRNRESVRTVMI